MSKIKEKVTAMNPKKFYLRLVVCFVIVCIAAGIGTMAKFGSRLPDVKQKIEENIQAGKQYKNNSKENYNEENYAKEDYHKEGIYTGEKDYKKLSKTELKNIINLTGSDYIFIGCVVAVFWIILCIFWLYTVAYAVSKSWELGINAWVFGILAFVTNIFGVACMWIYIKIHNVCQSCGKLQSRKANNCSYCGAAMYLTCPDCKSRISIKDKYCTGCGRKMFD